MVVNALNQLTRSKVHGWALAGSDLCFVRLNPHGDPSGTGRTAEMEFDNERDTPAFADAEKPKPGLEITQVYRRDKTCGFDEAEVGDVTAVRPALSDPGATSPSATRGSGAARGRRRSRRPRSGACQGAALRLRRPRCEHGARRSGQRRGLPGQRRPERQ